MSSFILPTFLVEHIGGQSALILLLVDVAAEVGAHVHIAEDDARKVLVVQVLHLVAVDRGVVDLDVLGEEAHAEVEERRAVLHLQQLRAHEEYAHTVAHVEQLDEQVLEHERHVEAQASHILSIAIADRIAVAGEALLVVAGG